MVINLTDLKQLIARSVLNVLDHTHLDLDHSFFHDRPSTTENLLLVISELLTADWQQTLGTTTAARISQIRLAETDKNVFTLILQ